MTILDPILYADGALRLTDHGPRGGGVVLVHVASGRQVTIPEGCDAAYYIEQDAARSPFAAFDAAEQYVHHWKVRQQEKFVPFYHD